MGSRCFQQCKHFALHAKASPLDPKGGQRQLLQRGQWCVSLQISPMTLPTAYFSSFATQCAWSPPPCCMGLGALGKFHGPIHHVHLGTLPKGKCSGEHKLPGNVCPRRARRVTFGVSKLTLAPSLSAPREGPQIDRTANLLCKASCTSQNMRIQQHKISLRMSLINNIIPTSVGVNTSRKMLLTLTTNCDGGALVTTQHKHFYLSLILGGGRVALVRPNMRRNMVPWSIRRVADLPLNAKLRKIQ